MIAFAKLSECKLGTILYPDDCFTCMGANHPKEVKVGNKGALFVNCAAGEHYLDGQLSGDNHEGDELVGLSLEPWPGLILGAKQPDKDS